MIYLSVPNPGIAGVRAPPSPIESTRIFTIPQNEIMRKKPMSAYRMKDLASLWSSLLFSVEKNSRYIPQRNMTNASANIAGTKTKFTKPMKA